MFLLSQSALRASKAAPQPDYLLQLNQLAAAAAARPWRTVMDKSQVPPSGDKHDYISFGPYWWPNPDSPDGLPYVRRDGLLNPETAQSDKTSLAATISDAESLALRAFYTDNERFAGAATQRLRAWFVDEATRMNPHLQYGQAIPGICEGRGIGIIDTVALRFVPDMMQLLQEVGIWHAEDTEAVQQWMAAYLDWLLTSEHGQREATEHNNHGTWYYAQVALLALATGNTAVAREVLTTVPVQKFAAHIAADGSQPHELARTRSFSYSCYNLAGLFDLARLGEHVGLDLWSWQGENGATLARAVQFLAPYADRDRPWPHPQVVEDDGSRLLELLLRARNHFPEGDWQTAINHVSAHSATAGQLHLMWPAG